MKGRKSLAKKLYDEVEVDKTPGQSWLVFYDFLGTKPSPNFWSNLHRLSTMLEDGTLTQYSVFKPSDPKGAVVAGLLAQHYGAEILFFKADEPTSDLDPENAKILLNILREQNSQKGTTVIIASTDLETVKEYTTRNLVIEAGKLL